MGLLDYVKIISCANRTFIVHIKEVPASDKYYSFRDTTKVKLSKVLNDTVKDFLNVVARFQVPSDKPVEHASNKAND